ncbi:MAG: glycosyltransferase family 2 protein, partial [Deltaproteobacteria bacterium]|nr:glycosyltransferase family 2 protein [Deltaproteobacteria bacterium]
SDMEVGYKVFRAEVLRSVKIESRRFGFEPEVTVKVAKKGYRIYEVPMSYHGRTYAEGKKITWKDGIVAFYSLVRYSLKD